ncbi:hypothetical protein [Pseudorhodoferax sp. Leaf267]|uniref:hypothetical protein n=1 Tax=Pseudorhodoferax sp. Leaf267 TaxID=1736316 RepID=UPI0012E2CADA|nr:hypothetical protein [Pseudorhodoferax sp. Leaf267]
MDDYPRMLYRPGTGPSELWGALVDKAIVNNAQEEAEHRRRGWLREPVVAVARAKRQQATSTRWRWFLGHWQFWITTAIALCTAVVAYLALG